MRRTAEEPDAATLAEHGAIHSTADGRFGDIFDPAVWESPDYTDRSWRMPIISSNFKSYIDIEQIFDYVTPAEEIVEEHQEQYPDLTAENLAGEIDVGNWELAAPLENVVILTDHPGEVAEFLEGSSE